MSSLAARRPVCSLSFSCDAILSSPICGAALALHSCRARGRGCVRASLHSRPLESSRGSRAIVRAGAAEEGEEEGKSQQLSIARLGSQVLICILTLGFLDAGYSGDWSRIGVLSKEVESALRVGAYGVVPLALLLVWFISSSNKRS